jgi:hypothetical protein
MLHEVFRMFHDLPSMFNSEKYVPDGLQECSKMNTGRRSERNSYVLVKWTDLYEEGIVKLVQSLDKCLNRSGDCV